MFGDHFVVSFPKGRFRRRPKPGGVFLSIVALFSYHPPVWPPDPDSLLWLQENRVKGMFNCLANQELYPFTTEQARKARRCDSYLQFETINDPLTDPLTYPLTGLGDAIPSHKNPSKDVRLAPIIASYNCKGLLSHRYMLSCFLGTSTALFVWLLHLFVCRVSSMHVSRPEIYWWYAI